MGLIKESVIVIALNSEGETLLVEESSKDGSWGQPRGTVEDKDDSPLERAYIEFPEETGIDDVTIKPEPLFIIRQPHIIRYGFIAVEFSGELKPTKHHANKGFYSKERFERLGSQGLLRPWTEYAQSLATTILDDSFDLEQGTLIINIGESVESKQLAGVS